jgi:hypothetical protein
LLAILLAFCIVISGCAPASTTTTAASPSTTTPSTTLPNGQDLSFETISSTGELEGPYPGGATLRVLTHFSQAWDIADWVFPSSLDSLMKVDYVRYFVVVVFNGYRYLHYTKLEIQRIWRVDNTIYVMAYFEEQQTFGVPIDSSQYQAVRIEKSALNNGEEYTFILVSEDGAQRGMPVKVVME